MKTTPLLCCVLCLVGCGGTGDVSGQVIFNGKPLVLGTVTLFSARGPHTGVIQPDGTYMVKEVPVGDVKVAVSSRDPKPKPGRKKVEMPKEGPRTIHPAYDDTQVDAWFPVPEIPHDYTDPLKSGLSYTVKSGDNTYDIELVGEVRQASNGRRASR